ncbi:MAG: carbohydrate-binding protein, partial [Lachnospiraceae bacterium]|nr:carbohydrate-binding protein [Lachnospiraceae bacterium]
MSEMRNGKKIRSIISLVLTLALVLSLLPVNVFNNDKAKAADTWRSSLYPENWTPGYTNSNGQFLHDFSYAGYMKGEEELPTSMPGLYADVTAYGADKTGANDSTSAIQSAIDAVQNAGGGTVYLPAGTYKVKPSSNANASALKITGSNILFKGDGAGTTFIRCFAENMRYCQVINVSPSSGTWDSADDGNYYYLSQDIPNTPTTTIHLNSVGNLKAGDWVIIRSDRTQSWIDEHSMGGFWSASVNPTTMGTTFYRQITSVNSNAKTIEIDIPTRYYMKTRDNARVYKVSPKQSNVGLMGFSIGNKMNPATSGWGEEDYTTSGTGAYNVNNAFLIKFGLNVNCFAKDIKTYQAGNASQIHMVSNGLDINKTRNLTVDSCDFSYPQYEGGGGNGYGINICGQETLIKNCSSTSARHSFAFKYSYANGNVIYHYTSTDPKYGSDFHMYLSMSNLIDNEELNGDFVETNVRPYGSTEGNRHGYTSTQTVFWNTKGNYYKSGSNYVIDSRQFGYGYIIGTQGSATAVKTTPTSMSSTYGTVNTAPEDFKEGIGTGASLAPQSLYYDQLAKRLAREGGGQPDVTVTNVPGTVDVQSYSDKTSTITFTTSNGVTYAGNLNNASYLDYQINAAESGEYTVNLNLAAGDAQWNASNIIVKVDDVVAATVPVIGSTGWETFIGHTAKINLTAGRHKLTLAADSGACNIANFSLSKYEPADNSGLRIVGYMPSYRMGSFNNVDVSKLTHCMLAFMTYANGTCTSTFSDSQVRNVVNRCHENGVKVQIALGGGGGFNVSDAPFSTAAKRTSIVNQVMNYVDTYNLDGVDIDIEVTDSNVWANFDAFISELSARLKTEGKLLTMAVSSWFTGPIQNSTYNYFDFLNLMTYDYAAGNGPVAPMSMVTDMVSHYGNKGVSNDRMTIGVPFYGYGPGGYSDGYSYAEIIAADINNKTKDTTTYNGKTVYYNGETTIRQKAEFSKNYGGIMIWELGQDSFGSNSLLTVIKNVIGETQAPTEAPTEAPTQAPAGNYDLIVKSVSYSPSQAKAGDSITFSAVVENAGTKAVPSGTVIGVRFHVDGNESVLTWGDQYQNGLAAGQSVTITANGGTNGSTWAATAGSHTVTAWVDDVNRLPEEADENNNQKNLAFTVSQPQTQAPVTEAPTQAPETQAPVTQPQTQPATQAPVTQPQTQPAGTLTTVHIEAEDFASKTGAVAVGAKTYEDSQYITGFAKGDSATYNVNVADGGMCTIDIRASIKYAGTKVMNVYVDGTLAGTVDIQSTGSFATFQTFSSAPVYIGAGNH